MKGLKLKPAQYKELQGLTLKEKLAQLKSWFEAGEVNEKQLRHFSDRWIKKEHKCSSNQVENSKGSYKTVFEIEVQQLINELLPKLKVHIAERKEETVLLTEKELKKIEEMLGEYRPFPIFDEFIIIAMRYPDKRLNKMAVAYVRRWRMESNLFWVKLWEDENLVPLDAVRLMMPEKEKIDERFSKETLFFLLPLIEAQRDKEIQRLEWAIAVGFEAKAAHRNRRLEAFNALIAAIKS